MVSWELGRGGWVAVGWTLGGMMGGRRVIDAWLSGGGLVGDGGAAAAGGCAIISCASRNLAIPSPLLLGLRLKPHLARAGVGPGWSGGCRLFPKHLSLPRRLSSCFSVAPLSGFGAMGLLWLLWTVPSW